MKRPDGDRHVHVQYRMDAAGLPACAAFPHTQASAHQEGVWMKFAAETPGTAVRGTQPEAGESEPEPGSLPAFQSESDAGAGEWVLLP